MAYINVSGPTSQVKLQINTGTISTPTQGYMVPALQDVTVNNAAGVFNWTQLDEFSQKAVPTPATNSISANLVVDDKYFFGHTTGVVTGTTVKSLFNLQNDAELIYFRVYFNGTATNASYVEGSGYLTNLAPTVNPTAPVWVSPITISVDGDLAAAKV